MLGRGTARLRFPARATSVTTPERRCPIDCSDCARRRDDLSRIAWIAPASTSRLPNAVAASTQAYGVALANVSCRRGRVLMISVMGFNAVSWLPGRERHRTTHVRSRAISGLRAEAASRARERMAARALDGSLISLAALIGTNITDPRDRNVGRVRDVVVRWTCRGSYPAITAVIVRTDKRDVRIGARWVEVSAPGSVRLRATRAYTTEVERHPADVALAHDVLDKQVVDSAGVHIVRPADIYLAVVGDRIEAVGIEVGMRALLSRLGPKVLRRRSRPERVIDWASIAAFAPARADDGRHRGRRGALAGQAGTGLELNVAANEVRRLHPSELEAALREALVDAPADSR